MRIRGSGVIIARTLSFARDVPMLETSLFVAGIAALGMLSPARIFSW